MSDTKPRTENRVYLEGLIAAFEAEGFAVGLAVKRDGFNRYLWFKCGSRDYWDFPLAPTAQKAAGDDADRIWTDHVEMMKP